MYIILIKKKIKIIRPRDKNNLKIFLNKFAW